MLPRKFAFAASMYCAAAVACAAGSRGDAVSLDFGDQEPKAAQAAASGEVMHVVATGAGLDPQNALENAFSGAIEQAVGALVSAETLVENDTLVSEKVLTFSRGFVQEFDVVRRWEKEGLHYARIRATVSVHELVEKLKANKIAMRAVPGQLFYLQARQEIDSAEAAAELVMQALDDLRTEKLIKVEIADKPALASKDANYANLVVRVRLSADLANWNKLLETVRPVFVRVSSKQQSFSRKGFDILDYDYATYKSLTGHIDRSTDMPVALFKMCTPTGSTSYWDLFTVPRRVGDVLGDIAAREGDACRLAVALLDGEGNVIQKITDTLADKFNRTGGKWKKAHPGANLLALMRPLRHHYWFVGPLLWSPKAGGGESWTSLSYTATYTFRVDLDRLADVAKCAAYIDRPE